MIVGRVIVDKPDVVVVSVTVIIGTESIVDEVIEGIMIIVVVVVAAGNVLKLVTVTVISSSMTVLRTELQSARLEFAFGPLFL